MKRIELRSKLILGEEKTIEVPVDPEGIPILEVEPDPEKVYEELNKMGMGDGLPIIPPTAKRVRRALEWSDRSPDEVIGKIPPYDGEATVEKIAVNAVMAGCEPIYMPILITAVEACAEAYGSLKGGLATTFACWPMFMLNGPIRNEIGINCSWGFMGSGFRPNSTLGRALTLIFTTIGGTIPGITEKKPTGGPHRYGIFFGENEELNPWPPLHVEKGFEKDISTVTIFPGVELLHNCTIHGSGGAKDELRVLCRGLSNLSEVMVQLGAAGAPLLLVFNPITAKILQQEGWSKEDVKKYIFINARVVAEEQDEEQRQIPVAGFARPMWPKWVEESPMRPVVTDPGDIWIVVAGSEAEVAQDGFIQSHPGHRGGPVIKPITLADGTPAKRLKEFHKVL